MPPPDGVAAPTDTTDPVDDFFKSEAKRAAEPPKAPADQPDITDAYFSQVAGAKKALLASSLAGASPDYGTKIPSADHDELVKRHPELSTWLNDPENARHGVTELPQLQQLSAESKTGKTDLTGILPPGFMFLPDGKVRGPLNPVDPDGQSVPPVVYKSLADVQSKLSTDATRRALEGMEYDTEHGGEFQNVGAGLRGSISATLAALGTIGGNDYYNRREVLRSSEEQLGEAAARDPSLSGGIARTVGQLIGDAPLYLLGGEVAGVADVAKSLSLIKAATRLPAVPRSTYMEAFWKNAANFAPIGARSGINTGAENGPVYGSVDFLLNTFGPAAAGRFGIASDIIKSGEETAAAAGGWGGVGLRIMAHTTSNAAAMGGTELANALHEYTSGIDPDALKSENLLPRLAQAGAMGGVLPLAFHLPGEIGNLMMRRQVAANAAFRDADAAASLMESAEAIKAFQASPERGEELLKGLIGDGPGRLKFYQSEDFEALAKQANMTPDDMATKMGIGDEYRKAVATGQVMNVPYHKVIQFGMESEDPAVKTALVTAMQSHPNGINANEAAKFFKETPDELKKQKLDLESDVTKAAQEMKESDPIYQDIVGKIEEGKRPPMEAEADARLIAARFNILAHRHNATAKERGAKLMEPVEEYQKYKLQVQQGGGDVKDTADAVLNRIRRGDIPTEKQANGISLREFLSRRGLQDVGGDLKSMGVDEGLNPGANKLIDPEGWGLDIAAERAHDEGFIEDSDPNTLLAALGEEAAGRPVYAAGNEHPKLGPLREFLMGIASDLKSKGIDIARPNPEIKAALVGDPMVARFEQPAFHGSGRVFNEFSTEHMGTGSGAQMYGWGLYAAQNKKTGQFYKEALAGGRVSVNGRLVEEKGAVVRNAVQLLRDAKGTTFKEKYQHALERAETLGENGDELADKVADQLIAWNDAGAELKDAGALYHIDIPEDKDLLHWEDKITEQPPKVRKALQAAIDLMTDDRGPFGDEPQIDLSKSIDAPKDTSEWSGFQVYQTLSSYLGKKKPAKTAEDVRTWGATDVGHVSDDEAASKWLLAHGVLGSKYLDDTPGIKDGSHNYVIYDPQKIAINRLEQPGDKSPRGSMEWDAARHFVMTLNGNADLSTVSHEAGHFWLEVLGDYAQRPDADPKIVKDYHDILEFVGYGTHENKAAMLKEMQDIHANAMREGRDLTAAEQKRLTELAAPHEKFADALVQYLREGKAPTPELKPVFQRFRLWLNELYKKFKELVHLSPEVKSIFDRMHATDEAIQEVQKDLGTSTIFMKGNPGLPEKDWERYVRSVQHEHDQLDNKVYSQATAVMRKENTKTYNREKDKYLATAKGIVMARPENVAMGILRDGVNADGSKVEKPIKLDKKLLDDTYGKGNIHLLPRGIVTDDGTGISLQAMADKVGLPSGSDLWDRLANYRKPKEVIAEMADGLMKAHHPEMTPEAMHDAAMDAVHANAAHADVLSQESAFLALKALKKPMSQEELKGIAEHQIDNTNMQDVNPQSHLRAEMKFSDKSTEAFLKDPPDYTEAFLMKQRQELSHALYRASMEAQDVIEKTGELMKKLGKTETRQKMGKAGGFVVVGKAGEVLATLDGDEAAKWVKEYNGTTYNFRDYLDGLVRAWDDKPTRYDLDYGQLHDLYREATSIYFHGKQAFSLLVEGKKVALAEGVSEAIQSQKEATKGKVITVPRDERELSYRAKDWFRWGEAGNRTLAGILESLDGEKKDGWHYRNIMRPISEAADNELERKIKNTQEFKSLVKTWGKRGESSPVLIPSIGEHLKLEQRIAVMLNAGTRVNHERMMTGDGWTPQQINDIIGTLDEKDVAFAHGIWGLLEKQWPEISALKSKVEGVPPVKKEPIPVKTRFGTVEGGYYPILYKKAVGARAFELSLEKPITRTTGAPRQGFNIEAVESTGMKLKYSFDAISRHLDDTAHYLSHEEARTNINKIINNKAFAQSVIDHFGIRTYERMAERILNVMQGPRGPQNAVEDGMRFIRTRTGLATCGYNAMTVLVHGFGVPQSMYRVGMGKWLAAQAEICSSAGSLESVGAFIDSKSSFMKNSHHNVTPETGERISQGLPGGALQTMQDHALDGLHLALRTINRATWLAEYRTRLAEERGGATEAEHDARAVQLANSAVRETQGSAQTADKTYFQDASEFTKMFMQYASFFTRTYQMLRPSIAGFEKGNPQAYLAVMKAFLPLVVLPAVAEGIFRQNVKPEGSDHDAKWWAERLAKDNLEYLLSMFIGGREISGMVEGFQYSGPASMRSIGSLGTAFGNLRKLVEEPSETAGGKALRSANAMAGLLFGIPSNQIDHIVRGIIYMNEHGSVNPAPALFGPPR